MSNILNGRQEGIPYWKIAFSPVQGIQIESNMDKFRVMFELEKYLEFLKVTTQPGEGLVPPPPPMMGMPGIIPQR